MRNRPRFRFLLPFLCVTALWPVAGHAALSCPASPVQRLALPHLKAALQAGQPVVIAALGSSSTWGAMARDIADSYPAELQDDLTAMLPRSEISVINRGIGGEDAGREDARMVRDVLALRPTLVIWQVGANAAARHETISHFDTLVQQGLNRLATANIDVILMDNQRSRILLASPDNHRIDAALAQLASENHVSLFSRNQLMQHWPNPDHFLAPDGLHMNDQGYACTAQALATAIVKAVARQ